MSASSIQIRSVPSCGRASRPNSNFVSARMMPRGSAYAAARAIDVDADPADTLRDVVPDKLRGLLEGNIFVVAADGLRRGREDRLRQAIGFAKSRGQRDAADFSGGAIILPAGAGHVAANDAFDRQRLRLAHHHRAAGKFVGVSVKWRRKFRGAQHVIWYHVAQKIEPEERKLRQHACLCREFRSAAPHRMPRADRTRRSADCRRDRRCRAPCRGRQVICRRNSFHVRRALQHQKARPKFSRPDSPSESATHSSAAPRDVKFSSGGFFWKKFLCLDTDDASVSECLASELNTVR